VSDSGFGVASGLVEATSDLVVSGTALGFISAGVGDTSGAALGFVSMVASGVEMAAGVGEGLGIVSVGGAAEGVGVGVVSGEGVAAVSGKGVGVGLGALEVSVNGAGVTEGAVDGNESCVVDMPTGEVSGIGEGDGDATTVELPSPVGMIFFATSATGIFAIGLGPILASRPTVLPLIFL